MALFRFGRPRAEEAARRVERLRVEAWAREAGSYREAVVIRVSEIVCADPACPGFETVILVMAPGERSQARKVAKPLAEVTREDVFHAIQADG